MPYFSVFLLAFLITFLTSSTLTPPDPTSATTTYQDNNAVTSLDLSPTLSFALSKTNIALSVQPTPSGKFTYGTTTATVTTSNSTGYTLTMTGANGSNSLDFDTSGMSDADKNSIADSVKNGKISSITSDVSVTSLTDTAQANFPTNSWGYAIGNTASSSSPLTFKQIPTSATTINSSTAPATNNTTNITVGAKASDTIASGKYTGTITLTAVTNYVPGGPTFSGITKMQEMNSTICDMETTPLASATATTTTATTDQSLVPEATLVDERDNTSYTVRKLADGNCWMVQNLALDLNVGDTLTSSDSNVTSDFTIDTATQTTTGTVWPSGADGDVQRSYHTGNASYGNYYNWYTATAGTGTYSMTSSSADATSSICPKGWKLPNGRDANIADSFAALASAYSAGNNAAGSTIMRSVPLSFVYPGRYNYSNGNVVGQGSIGDFWSSTASNNTNARYLDLGSSYANPQYFDTKAYGFAVRCIAQ